MGSEQLESLLRGSLQRLLKAAAADKKRDPKDKDALAALKAECDRCLASISSPGDPCLLLKSWELLPTPPSAD